jgi:hypothetical protein
MKGLGEVTSSSRVIAPLSSFRIQGEVLYAYGGIGKESTETRDSTCCDP